MTYTERLGVPAAYWLVGLLVGVTTAFALGFYLGEGWALAIGALATAGVCLALFLLGRTVLSVDADGVRAGASLLEWPYVGEVEALDADRTQRVQGPDADLRDFTVYRTWIPTSVRVTVDDAADPHPSWLLSTRRPEAFVRAVEACRPGAVDRRG